MRKLAILAVAGMGCVSKGTDVPKVTAGSGLTVTSEQLISIDPARVPLLPPTCASNQVVTRNVAGDDWSCVDTVANAASLGGRTSDLYALKTSTVANANQLGGVDGTAYALKTDTVANANALGALGPDSYRQQAPGTHALIEDIPLAGFRTTHTARPCLVRAGALCLSSATTTISIEGVLCGTTPPTTGAFSAAEPGVTPSRTATGYRAGKILCEATCGKPNAHMCTGNELVRTRQVSGAGDPNPVGWIAVGVRADFGARIGDECGGFTSASNTQVGPIWSGTNPALNTCDTIAGVLCCE